MTETGTAADYEAIGGATNIMDGPATALLQAYAQRIRSFTRQLYEEGWDIENVLTHEDDGSVVYAIRCTLRRGPSRETEAAYDEAAQEHDLAMRPSRETE